MAQTKKGRWKCGICGGENVNCSGPMTFNYDTQAWENDGSTHEDDYCTDCQEEVTLEFVPDGDDDGRKECPDASPDRTSAHSADAQRDQS